MSKGSKDPTMMPNLVEDSRPCEVGHPLRFSALACQSSAATLPALQDDVGGGAGLQDLRPLSTQVEVLEKLGGGNPKMMYTNFKMHAEVAIRGPRSACDSKTRRSQLQKQYDDDPRIRETWKELFRVVQNRKKRGAIAGQQDRGDVGAIVQSDKVWPSRLHPEGRVANVPIHTDVLANTYKDRFGSLKALDSHEASVGKACTIGKAVAAESIDIQGLPPRWGSLWGCVGGLHNVCQRSVPNLRSYTDWGQALNKLVQQRKGIDARTAELVLAIEGVKVGAPKAFTYVLLGQPVFSPVVQTYIRCYDLAREPAPDTHFVCEEPAGPNWTLRLAVHPSRLSLPASDRFKCLWHETSDELCKRLSSYDADRQWFVSVLQYEIVEGPTLLDMKVTGVLETTEMLKLRGKAKPVPDLMREFHLPKGCPFAQGGRRAGADSSSSTFAGGVGGPIEDGGGGRRSRGCRCRPG